MTTPLSALAAVPGTLAGGLLGATFGAAARIRRTKPLHPQGRVGEGLWDLTAGRPELRVPLLAAAGARACTVRWSRAMGLPAPLPDFEGLALRFLDPAADLLFASTGTGAVGRFVLVPRRAGTHGPQTTLLPVSTRGGSLLFRADPVVEPGRAGADPPSRYAMSVARAGSDWSEVGLLTVSWGPDRPTRFDPVEHPLPGTEQYPLVRALRAPAYRQARRNAAAGPEPAGGAAPR
jgi:hypothetical protein